MLLLPPAPAGQATPLTVRNTDHSGNGSLRQALKDAKDGDSIIFGSEVHGEIMLKDTLDIDTDASIKGPGASVLTLRGREDEVVTVDATVTLTGLTISGGETAVVLKHGKLNLLDCVVRDSSGDGVANRGGRLTLVRSLVADNHGIGIANASGTITCVNSTIAGNGGAGLALEEGSATAASCTIARNGGTGLDAG